MRQARLIFIAIVLLMICVSAGVAGDNTATQTDQAAIDFTLPDQNGKLWTLSDTLKDYKAVVLAFYPKDNTGV